MLVPGDFSKRWLLFVGRLFTDEMELKRDRKRCAASALSIGYVGVSYLQSERSVGTYRHLRPE
jgi:hypothetical protein